MSTITKRKGTKGKQHDAIRGKLKQKKVKGRELSLIVL
jgi:hypothetical protein